MTETLDVTQLYIKHLENKICDVIKSTLILETNVNYLTSIIEQKNSQIEELNRNNFNFNETIGNIQNNHQNEIAELKKDYENRFSQIHLDAMNEIEKLHNEKNKMYQDLGSTIQDLRSKLSLEQETSLHWKEVSNEWIDKFNKLQDDVYLQEAKFNEFNVEKQNKKTNSKKSKNKVDLSF